MSAEAQLSEVSRLATLLADRVLDAQIMSRPVPDEHIRALSEAALLHSETMARSCPHFSARLCTGWTSQRQTLLPRFSRKRMPPMTTSGVWPGCSGHSKGQRTIQDEVRSNEQCTYDTVHSRFQRCRFNCRRCSDRPHWHRSGAAGCSEGPEHDSCRANQTTKPCCEPNLPDESGGTLCRGQKARRRRKGYLR